LEPVVFDNLSLGHRSAVRWGPLIEGDLSDTAAIERALAEHRPEAVIHFAANAYVGESVRNPRKYFQNNAANSLNLLSAMLDQDVRNIIFSSSCATYGVPQVLPLSEDHPQLPVNPYGESKLFVERVLRWYGQAYDLRWVALRYFNASGADPDGELGEEHNPETHLIPLVLLATRDTQPALQIFGADYSTPDGTAVRDYIHVSDLADAHVRALRHLLRGGESAPFNLGVGAGYSVRQVIQMAERVSGRRVPYQEGPRRAGDPATLVADATRARQVLGWTPSHSSLETILETAWRWFSRAS
jgi:UDP-glucose-4-epimerase GalE